VVFNSNPVWKAERGEVISVRKGRATKH